MNKDKDKHGRSRRLKPDAEGRLRAEWATLYMQFAGKEKLILRKMLADAVEGTLKEPVSPEMQAVMQKFVNLGGLRLWNKIRAFSKSKSKGKRT